MMAEIPEHPHHFPSRFHEHRKLKQAALQRLGAGAARALQVLGCVARLLCNEQVLVPQLLQLLVGPLGDTEIFFFRIRNALTNHTTHRESERA
jgi:hypothetical protein